MALAVAYALGVFVLGSLPAGASVARVNDKVAHAVVFAGQFALLSLGLSGRAPSGVSRLWWGGLGALALGGALELWQSLLPYRQADVWDFAADAGGIALAIGVTWGWRRMRLAARSVS
jgi:hypothetical protein